MRCPPLCARVAGLIVALLIAGAPGGAVATPLCPEAALAGDPAAAGFPALGAAPVVSTWSRAEAAAAASSPQGLSCTGLRTHDAALLVSVAAHWRSDASAETLLARVGAVSRFKGITYWSHTDQRREVLITDAAAVEGPASRRRRADFSLAELSSGQPLYFVQRDNRSNREVLYRLQMLRVSAQGWAVSLENVDPIRRVLLTLAAPGEVQTVITLQQLAPGEWGCRSFTGVRTLGPGPADRYRAAYINRAVAMVEHLTH